MEEVKDRPEGALRCPDCHTNGAEAGFLIEAMVTCNTCGARAPLAVFTGEEKWRPGAEDDAAFAYDDVA